VFHAVRLGRGRSGGNLIYLHLRREGYTERQIRKGTVISEPTVRISEASYQVLKELAEQTGETMMDVLDHALDDYRRKVFLDAVNAGYAALKAVPEAWAEHLAERELWDVTLMDGLDPDERWSEDGRCPIPPVPEET
jgi:hypothetical protein